MKRINSIEKFADGAKFFGYARVFKKRYFGAISFWKVRFQEEEVQLFIQKKVIENFSETKKIALGSLIFFEGEKMVTKTGEPSIAVSLIRVEHDGHSTLQDKLSGVNHISRSGNRVLDMTTNKQLFDYLLLLSELLGRIRKFLIKNEFKEFITGTLQEYFEGGRAEPFQTQCKTNGKTLYLSLTSELKLKRLMVAGFEKVYEISQSFRNEGIDRKHLPEFTLLELYAVNQNYKDMMNLLEKMMSEILFGAVDEFFIANKNSAVDFRMPFVRKTFDEACLEFLGIREEYCTIEWLAEKFPTVFSIKMDEFTWMDKLVNKFFTPNFIKPTFLVDVPSGISPFAKKHSQNNRLSESAFFIAMGVNIATISTDENDVEKISALLFEQSKKTGKPVNRDYLNVLEFGLPPTAGIGFGLNRFFMLLQEGEKSARETCPLPIF